MAVNTEAPEFLPASDRSLLVSFAGGISPAAHERVVALSYALLKDPPHGVSDIHPAYCSVLVVFDPLRTWHDEVMRAVMARLGDAPGRNPTPKTVVIPVCYGGEFGPDLDDVAALHGLSVSRVVELHSSATYVAQFIGFAPGYAYLSGVPEEIVTPRLEVPRQRVPAGSVAIAGRQAGIYPFATPGGWRLIGRTPLAMFDAARHPMSLITLGDLVRFQPIDCRQFEETVR